MKIFHKNHRAMKTTTCQACAHNSQLLALLPLPASTRALTGEMKADAQFTETRGQREIELPGLDRQELAPIVAGTIRRAVIKRGGRDRRGLTLVMVETKRWAREITVRLHRTI